LDAHPDGWMGRLASSQGKPEVLQERWDFVDEIQPNVRRLQDACRAAGMEVIHIRIGYLTKDCRDAPHSLADDTFVAEGDKRDDDFLEMVAPMGDEIIINKTTAGAFNSTNIDSVLRNLGIDRLWVTGIVTEGCVEVTTRDAADRGYYCTLVSDGCASSTHVAHEDALQRMGDGGLIKVKTVDDLIGLLA
jgi:nicotinamidase-related amidase